MVTRMASLPTTCSLLLDLYYAGTKQLLKMSLRGAWQCEAALALRPSAKSLSNELRILLVSWHVILRKFRLRLRFRLSLRLGGGGGSAITTRNNAGLRLGLR